MELKVAEDRLSDMILPVAFSDSVPAKKTWTAGWHVIHSVIILSYSVKTSLVTGTTTVA